MVSSIVVIYMKYIIQTHKAV